MGRNGAGKSTLLRVIAGTLDPSSGSVSVSGRVSAILELGSGFHGDYSGRENVYLGGLCMGLSREEITKKFDEIVAFAELEEFIDRPFRTYSSGMQARLTFAVATSIDPDILIIDEALSVGDARFAMKSFDRIRDFKARGKAILFVSHSANQVVSICDRAILLDRGAVVAEGESSFVAQRYHEILFGRTPDVEIARNKTSEKPETATSQGASFEPAEDAIVANPLVTIVHPIIPSRASFHAPNPPRRDDFKPSVRYGNRDAVITGVLVRNASRPDEAVRPGDDIEIELQVEVVNNIESICFGFLICSVIGIDIYGNDTRFTPSNQIPSQLTAGTKVCMTFAFKNLLTPGHYFITTAIAAMDETKYDMWFDCAELVVLEEQIHQFTSSVVKLDVRGNFTVVSHPQAAE